MIRHCYIFLLVVGLKINCSAQLSLDDWRCDQIKNSKNLYSLVGRYMQSMFDIMGNSSWITEPKPFISCFRKGLTEVPRALNTNVTILELSQNSITKIRRNDFVAYKSLIAIMIVENCAEAYIYNTEVQSPCKSRYLDISSNAFKSLSNLKYLDLSGNLMKDIPANLSKNLVVLDIFFSTLGRLKSSHIKDLTSLQILILSANCFGASSKIFCKQNFSIENFSLSSSNLSYLDLSFNNLSKIPSKLLKNSLLGLNLRGNPIHSFSRNDFKNCTNLTHLYISWTAKYDFMRLNIHPHALIDLHNLKHLDLSGNMLRNWSKHILPQNSQLQTLNLAFNCFNKTVQNPDFLPPLDNLTMLDLSSNTFCSSQYYPSRPIINKMKLGIAFLKFRNLEVLRLGMMNKLNEQTWSSEDVVANGVKFDTVDNKSLTVLRYLTKLHTLEMVLIGIRNLSTDAFKGLENLRNLKLQYNHIGEPPMRNDSQQNVSQKHSFQSSRLVFDSFLMFPVFLYRHQLSPECSQRSDRNQSLLVLSRNAISDLDKFPLKYFPMTTKLDLSNNRINYISADTFKDLKKLIEVNLKFNPIRFIHWYALDNVPHLKHFMLYFTAYQEQFNLAFLQNSVPNLTLQYGDIANNFFRLMEHYRKQNISIKTVSNLQLSNIHIGVYDIATNKNIFKPFPELVHLSIESGKATLPLRSKFFMGVRGLRSLSMTTCWLQVFPHLSLSALPFLTLLDLSYNEIEYLERFHFSNISTHLQIFNLSHNFISYIRPFTLQDLIQRCLNLTIIDLSFNYIAYIDPNVIDRSVLERLSYLDLRGNVFECDCSLSENFGFLVQSEIRSLKLPGFLPTCTQEVQDYYGGCLTCRAQGFTPSISLFQYSITNYCQELFLTLLSVSSAAFIFLFVTFTLIAKSSITKDYLVKTLSHKVIGEKQLKRFDDLRKHAFDGFIYYDKDDKIIADWVDFVLVPKLEQHDSNFQISVVGKDDWCGATQVEQLLVKMEASRKTIVLLSGNFFESNQCRYVLAVLEEWIYSQGKDKSILITFAPRPLDVRAFRTRHHRNPGSVLNYPASLRNENGDPMFWNLLNNSYPVFWELLKNSLKTASHL